MGSAKIEIPDWVGTDIDTLNVADKSDWLAYFQAGSVKALLAEHVWEHLTDTDAAAGAGNCFEFLRPGGYIRVAVPDGFHPDRDYLEYVRPGGTGAGADDHKNLYTAATLPALFESVGFNVKLLEYWDAAGQFHYVDWNPDDGFISRSRRFDSRNADGKLKYTSLILDAVKPV